MLKVRGPGRHGYEEMVMVGGPEDAFRREWGHFGECIEHGVTPKTPLEWGLADIELAVELVRRLR